MRWPVEAFAARQLEPRQRELLRDVFALRAQRWMRGQTFLEIAQLVRMDIDNLLAVYTRAIAFTLQMLVEQGLSLLARRLQADGLELGRSSLG